MPESKKPLCPHCHQNVPPPELKDHWCGPKLRTSLDTLTERLTLLEEKSEDQCEACDGTMETHRGSCPIAHVEQLEMRLINRLRAIEEKADKKHEEDVEWAGGIHNDLLGLSARLQVLEGALLEERVGVLKDGLKRVKSRMEPLEQADSAQYKEGWDAADILIRLDKLEGLVDALNRDTPNIEKVLQLDRRIDDLLGRVRRMESGHGNVTTIPELSKVSNELEQLKLSVESWQENVRSDIQHLESTTLPRLRKMEDVVALEIDDSTLKWGTLRETIEAELKDLLCPDAARDMAIQIRDRLREDELKP